MQADFDEIETLILIALDANQGAEDDRCTKKQNGTIRKDEAKMRMVDFSSLFQMSEMKPSSFFTLDLVSEERIYAKKVEHLALHPKEILGDECETMIFFDGWAKWAGFRKVNGRPRRVAAMGAVDCWYEMHFRNVNTNGLGEYVKRIVPFDKMGRPLPAKIGDAWACSPEKEGAAAIISCSIVEDAHRSGSILVSVKDAKEIKFPVGLDAYKEAFALRDGPMSGDRRKAIVHWVSKHMRRSHKGNSHDVKKHTRGVLEFEMGGLQLKLDPKASQDFFGVE
jgi:hypothetical protein